MKYNSYFLSEVTVISYDTFTHSAIALIKKFDEIKEAINAMWESKAPNCDCKKSEL